MLVIVAVADSDSDTLLVALPVRVCDDVRDDVAVLVTVRVDVGVRVGVRAAERLGALERVEDGVSVDDGVHVVVGVTTASWAAIETPRSRDPLLALKTRAAEPLPSALVSNR